MNRSRTFIKQAVGIFYYDPGRRTGPTIVGRGVLLLFLILIISTAAFGQTTSRVAGMVSDAVDGQTLAGALISVAETDIQIRSDFFGRFSLEHLPPGSYRVMVSAEGYEPYVSDRIDVVGDITRRLTIVLNRKVHTAPDITVVEKRPSPTGSGTEIIERVEIERSGAASVADLLAGLRGLFVQKSGTGSDEVRVSIRGSDPKHVLVLLDGHRVNAAATGEANLGGIPLAAVQRVEVYRGGESARFGADALGGAVNIVTGTDPSRPEPEAAVRSSWGAWKTIGREATIANFPRLKKFTARLTYTGKTSDGDFPYHYVVSPRPEAVTEYSGTRSNAGLDSRSWFFSGSYRQSPKTMIDISGQWYRLREGLPGEVSAPDSLAWKKDLRLYGTLRLKHDLSSRSQIELSLGGTRLQQYFNNRQDRLAAERYESRYTNDRLDLQTIGRVSLSSRNELAVGNGVRRDILYHDDLYRPQASMGRTVRDNIGLYLQDKQSLDLSALPLVDDIALDAAVRWDHIRTANSTQDVTAGDADHWSQKTGLAMTMKGHPRIILRGGYGTSFRLPEINALFWKGDVRSAGNPNLRPERAEHSDAGIEMTIDRPVTLSAGITYFHSYVRDLIVWQPAYQGVWTPANLDAARLTGHEEYIRLGLFGGKVQLNYQNTITVAKNRTSGSGSYDNILTYRPHYVTDLEAVVALWKLRGSYRVRLVDIRYNREANTKWYDAYRVDDASIGFKAIAAGLMFQAAYMVNNLNGTDYVLIGHYPMPGRQWGIECSITCNLNDIGHKNDQRGSKS